ncbi:MAG: ABC transporter permease [Patescibacteria group bacterium]
MEIRSILKLSVNNLRSNRLRSFLTMLGLIIGIGSVVLIISVGAGAQSLILSQVNKLGSDLVGVLPGSSDENGPPASVFGIQVKTLINNDVKALLADSRTEHIAAASGYVRGMSEIIYQNRKVDGGVYLGVSANFQQIENFILAQGRFFTTEEENSLTRVVVVGSEAAEELFQGDNPIGQNIKIGRQTFRVIGQFEPRGTVAFTNQDNQVFIPLTTAQRILLGWHHLSLIRARVDNADNVTETIAGIKEVLREQHNIDQEQEDDFNVRSAAQALDILTSITNGFTFFLAAIAAISLLVGGIGIMNIMLVAVTERIKEIGLRKAVGATPKNIRNQFLIETFVITSTAAALGILGGVILSGIITLIARGLDYDWAFVVSFTSIILAVAVGVIIGLIFGYYPASRAANLDPITALHHE